VNEEKGKGFQERDEKGRGLGAPGPLSLGEKEVKTGKGCGADAHLKSNRFKSGSTS